MARSSGAIVAVATETAIGRVGAILVGLAGSCAHAVACRCRLGTVQSAVALEVTGVPAVSHARLGRLRRGETTLRRAGVGGGAWPGSDERRAGPTCCLSVAVWL